MKFDSSPTLHIKICFGCKLKSCYWPICFPVEQLDSPTTVTSTKKLQFHQKGPELDHTLVKRALLAGLVPVFFITNRQKVEMTGLVNILAYCEIDEPTQLQVFLIIFQNVKLHFLIHY